MYPKYGIYRSWEILSEQTENQSEAEIQESRTNLSAADTALPEIRPPNAGFILQLFLIPMMIV